MTLLYHGHPLEPVPSEEVFRLIRAFDERKRLAELGYVFDVRSESTLLTDALQVIETQLARLRAATRKRETARANG